MAVAYLAANSTSFAATCWSDTIGFADAATLVAKLDGQTVTSSVDWSTLTTGINRFLVPAGSNGGIGTSSAPLKVDIDSTTGVWDSAHVTRARFELYATGGRYYLQAGGASAVVSNCFADTGGTLYLTGGTVTTARLTNGSFDFDANTTIGTCYVWGPASGIIRPKTSALTDLYLYSGPSPSQWIVQRAASGSINVFAGMTVRYNVTSGTTAAVNLLGGRFLHEAGDITLVNGTAGAYEAKLEREATIGTFNRELPLEFTANDPLLTITTSVAFHPKVDL